MKNAINGIHDYEKQTIELDCSLGQPRPGDLIESVIQHLGLESKPPIVTSFGNWVWDYSEVPHETWLKIQPTLKERIDALYYAGAIRWGSW